MIRCVKIIPFMIVLLISYGCGMLGPASLKEGRSRYNQVIAYTGSEQMLINLVKLRYRDSPTFLQVSSISTNLQWGASASAQFRSAIPYILQATWCRSGPASTMRKALR